MVYRRKHWRKRILAGCLCMEGESCEDEDLRRVRRALELDLIEHRVKS